MAASFKMSADVSDAKSFEKSRPSFTRQFIVFPKSYEAKRNPKSTDKLRSLPGQLRPLVLLQIAVVGPSDSATDTTAPDFNNSFRTASKCLWIVSLRTGT